jgi:hypothetical protein
MSSPVGKNRIMIYGPNHDGTYVVEFRTAKRETLAISVPSGESSAYGQIFERPIEMSEPMLFDVGLLRFA